MIRRALALLVLVPGFWLSPVFPASPPLVWHVETTEGQVVASEEADRPINPASVVKVATSLWALERLGGEHRFVTSFLTDGVLDPVTGVLDGDLVVRGTGDPDFHVENAYLIARALNRIGLTRVAGALRVDTTFWIGWEGGTARKESDPSRRAVLMARRLRDALDPARWDRGTRMTMAGFAERRGFAALRPPAVIVAGAAGVHSGPEPVTLLAAHRSNPLRVTLKRFNAHSNNDLERLETSLGPAHELALLLNGRWSVERDPLGLATLSGLGVNRMTPRQIVRLLHEFRAVCDRSSLAIEDLLPAIGCDPGTLKWYPKLLERVAEGALVAKTGTLTSTDGGVALLAGYLHTTAGSRVFCVAAPASGQDLAGARAAVEDWVLGLSRHAQTTPRACGAAVSFSDDDALVIALE